MKFKLLSLFLAGALTLSLAACSSSEQSAIMDGEASQVSPTYDDQELSENTAGDKNEVAETATVTASIESAVLVDQGGVVITAQELVEDSIWGAGIKLLIENNSEKNQIIQCDYVVVNNFQMSTLLFSAEVAAGKKSNETLYFSNEIMEAADISTIEQMDFVFYSVDPDSFQRNFTTDEISLTTSASGQVEQPIPDTGKELYNQGGIRIVGNYVEEDTLWGAGVVLFIDNQSDQDMIISCDNMSINGFMVTPFFSANVNSGRMTISNITVLSSDLEANGIESVDDVELFFKGISPESYQTLFETEAITFSTTE